MTDQERANAKLVRAQARVFSAIKDLTDEEQDRVLDSARQLLGYSRPLTTLGEIETRSD